jgi:hypothetical protein
MEEENKGLSKLRATHWEKVAIEEIAGPAGGSNPER